MRFRWRRLIFPVAGITVVLAGVLAASRTQISAYSSIASFRPSIERTGPGGVLSILGNRPFALAGGQAGAEDRPLLAEEAFKNVQALRGIPVDDFMATMGVMTSSLAFDCSDCHEGAGTDTVDWAADTPRKVTARRMVAMVTAINKNNFGGRQMVTCYTCHRNRDIPLTTPTMAMLYGEPPFDPDDYFVSAKIPGMPTADQILPSISMRSAGPSACPPSPATSPKGKVVGSEDLETRPW